MTNLQKEIGQAVLDSLLEQGLELVDEDGDGVNLKGLELDGAYLQDVVKEVLEQHTILFPILGEEEEQGF